ncbi:hypothetical protein CDL15_Pgr008510 [Punica granatum]|uniref:Uncharacterized protein n=1 Tax=Punica granatum TaxID=22663 RepID=A0A218WMW2_PUNGR|nr:hypothetical protein CDL15_Pgr008510 [Punica granatum]
MGDPNCSMKYPFQPVRVQMSPSSPDSLPMAEILLLLLSSKQSQCRPCNKPIMATSAINCTRKSHQHQNPKSIHTPTFKKTLIVSRRFGSNSKGVKRSGQRGR